MASEDVDDPELKDEELVDFEGSDYDIGSEEELEVFGVQIVDELQVDQEVALQDRSTSEIVGDSTNEIPEQTQVTRNEDSTLADLLKRYDDLPSRNREAAETGEVLEEREDQDGGAGLQPTSSPHLIARKTTLPLRMRHRKHRKTDLEDGELDDAVMPEGPDLDKGANVKCEIALRERKRRKDRFVVERQLDVIEGSNAKESEEIGCPATRQQHNRGRRMEHLAGFARIGGRGNMRMMGFGQVAPGIMGAERPLMPHGIRSLGRGFGPLGGIALHGRPNVHLQELLAQEHLLRARAMRLAQESIAGAVRSPMSSPLGAAALRPFLGFDFMAPGSLQFQPQPPDLISQMNFMGAVDNFVRGHRPNLEVGRTGRSGKSGGQTESSSGRQSGWPDVVMSGEMLHLGRGWAQARGLSSGPWTDVQAMGHVLAGQGLAGGRSNLANMLNVSAGAQGSSAGIQNMSSEKVMRYGPSGLSVSRTSRSPGLELDTRYKVEKERMLRNAIHHVGMVDEDISAENLMGVHRDFGKDDPSRRTEAKFSALQGNPSPVRSLAPSASPMQAKQTASVKTCNPTSTAASNVIQLLQPVQKSRILTVSGLPENTSMSTIVEAFEKLGKIIDFRKGEKGDAFTISYSTEREAVTAKRHMHRSFLAGKQITVDYAHQ